MLRRTLLTAAAMLALGTSGALAQAGGKPMKITLNFLAAAPNAGFMMAKQMGLYEKAGINLTIEEGKGSGTTAQMVATGQTDVGFADAPAAMQLRTKGAPVKIVAPVLQTNGFAIISLEDSGIASPKDLVGKKLALVDDQPGVTRDRREGDASLGHLSFTVIDTAGLEEADKDSLAARMRAQTETAIGQADVVLFMIDARLGLTPMDHTFAELVRRSGKPVILLANKAEGNKGKDGVFESYSLGLGASYEIDLFGRVRSLTQAALESYLATEEGARATRIAMIAAI